MTGEQYGYGSKPPAPHQQNQHPTLAATVKASAVEQYAVQSPTSGVGAGQLTTARISMAAPPKTAGVSASASAARGYGALLNTQRQPHSTFQGRYTPQTGPVPSPQQQQQQQHQPPPPPPPLPQHYAVGGGNPPRRLSNAVSDLSDRVHAGPVRAGPANNHHDNSSGSDTSEDEIELLKQAMGSDQWALQRQRMRKEQLERQGAGSSEDPGSPATQNTSLSAAPPRQTVVAPPAPPRQVTAEYQHGHTQQGYQQSYARHGYEQSHPQQKYASAAEVSPQTQHTYAMQFQGYPQAQSPQYAQQQRFVAAYDGHQASPGPGPSSVYAYPVSSLGQQAYAQTHMAENTHWQHGQPPAQRAGVGGVYPSLATTNPFVHGTMAPVAHGLSAGGTYPLASSAGGEGSRWDESASARSNDQMSGTVTDVSGYSQAYWAHRHQSPTLVQAQAPLRAATDSPLERKMSGSEYPAPEHRQHLQTAAGPFATVDTTRTQGPETVAVVASMDGAGSGSSSAAGPQIPSSRMPFSYSASALAPMREMQEQQNGPEPAANAVGPPSALAIQSLLNTAQDDEAFEPTHFFGSDDGSGSSGGAAAIHQHIAKENARFRRQSGASGKAPMPAHSPRPQALRQAHAPPGNPDSSPNSHSSYHSTGYSTWLGHADTVMDYATAKQSFSSTDDPVPESSHLRPSAYHTDAPVPALPAPYAASSAAGAIRDFEATMPAVTVSEAIRDHKSIMQPLDHSLHPSPTSLAQVPSTSLTYYDSKNPISKPVSVLVQVGDNSQESSVNGVDAAPATVPGEAEASRTESPHAEPSEPEPLMLSADLRDAQNVVGRKATMESIDNVLEYYHTLSAPDDSSSHSQEASPVGRSARPRLFDLPQHSHNLTNRGSSLVSLHRQQTTPPYQRTSLSSPVDKAASRRNPVDTTLWPEMPSADSSPRCSSQESQLASAAAVNVFGWKKAADRPLAFTTLPPLQPRDDMLPADSGAWGLSQGPMQYADIYSRLERLSEPDDLQLPPSSAVPDLSPVDVDITATQQQGSNLAANDDDGMLQMESLDGVSVLSDIIDQGLARGSDCAYSNSNDSTDSFGEPIEGESGMLSKSLLDAVKRSRSAIPHASIPPSVSQLADTVARATIAQPSQSNAAPSSRSSPSPPSAGAHTDQLPPAEIPHSVRTNVSTLTGSTTTHDEHHSAASAADSTLREKHGTRAPVATASSSSGLPTIPLNCMPLEIMELASELELALAREQEDYYSDNDAAPPTLDPAILQNLGRAVHQQCLLQRQQIQRRKSNMQLGLTTAGSTFHEESLAAASVTASNSDAAPSEPHYDTQELALHAMLEEVSLYFTQSGLSLVFPFSAKWVNWLTRHPDRPFPWRKDPEDELARAAMRDDDDDDAEDGIDAEAQSDVSSFGGEPPIMSRPLPPDDVLSVAMIPMSKRRPARVTDFVTQKKRKGINAHWQYYSVINQIIAVASNIHRTLLLPELEADHSSVAHQLAALYQFLGGDFKKYKMRIEQIFDAIRQGLDTGGATDNEDHDAVAEHTPKVLGSESAAVLREMMASIIIDALYSMNRVAPVKDQPPNTPTGIVRPRQDQHHAARGEPVSYALSTLKGLPTQPILRYLTKEMRVVNAELHQRRRHQQHQQNQRGLVHNLSRNSSVGHLRHPQYMYQAPPPVPPLPLPAANSAGSSDAGPYYGAAKPQNSQDSSHNHHTLSHSKQHSTSNVVDDAVVAMLLPNNTDD
ncbi:hypothetical protein COEREDRAFT_86046 [Coemansia reversa NRRL 1564]|uniref:Uncharacterized protein n=1 Tax=Coemansia reversa (strain ATCC 12441 / NRRL 1564) TaxID=763665 RepID=A0A2G5BEI6_COERN|nr:hypothetical protein COEREDRAFT_86046 [Coemansia reversa NRRL 1564]|eukprot:PIA17413.1 hypothetical protein COEREDRAFT_86046 [Coemansia reversa NRRL 1564]